MFSRLIIHFFINDFFMITSHRDRQRESIVNKYNIDAKKKTVDEKNN